jgi:hypothetical protein
MTLRGSVAAAGLETTLKLVSLRVRNLGVRDDARSLPYRLTLFYVAGYGTLLALEVARWG